MLISPVLPAWGKQKYQQKQLGEELSHHISSLSIHFKDCYSVSARILEGDLNLLHRFENIARKRITWPDGWFLLPFCIYMHFYPSREFYCVPRSISADELRRPRTEDSGKQIKSDQGKTIGLNSPIQHSIDRPCRCERLSPGPFFLRPISHMFSLLQGFYPLPSQSEHL